MNLGFILDSRLGFNGHIDNTISKCNKIIGIMKILSLTFSGKSLLMIYKSFFRPNLDLPNITYDKPFIKYFKKKLKWFSIKQLLRLLMR